jgi:hypothetical protein
MISKITDLFLDFKENFPHSSFQTDEQDDDLTTDQKDTDNIAQNQPSDRSH